MKAQVFKKYGPPEKVLHISTIPKPIPKENELLIKLHATAVNDYDWALVSGRPKIYQLLFGLFKPKHQVPGMELSGIVEAMGSAVKEFNIGDAVYGDISQYGFGSFAEYICINSKAVIKKPEALSFVDAAAIPHASLLAYQALVKIGKIKKGMRVLINGGGGGVGTIGLQLAKHYECDVSGVDSNEKLAMMKSLGFDHVIDYKKEDFTKNGAEYDLILDCKTNKSAFAYLRSLSSQGIYVSIGGELSKILSVTIWGMIISLFSKKRIKMLALKPNEGLEIMTNLFIQQKIRTLIDGPYSLEEAPSLIRYFGEGKHKGKIILEIN
jgi:NADPH:quinone reductase-like Zn-dependent oxidoreductase